MKIGIVGLPLSGKTTLWSLLTETYEGVDAVHPGQKPRMKTVKVIDPRLERLRQDFQPKKFTPAQLEVYDFPAVQSEKADRRGMADLLAPARDMEALIVILSGFDDGTGKPRDPGLDWNEIMSDLIIADLVIVEKRIEKIETQLKKNPARVSDEDRRELVALKKMGAELDAERDLRSFSLSPEENKIMTRYGFLSAKPQVVVLNQGEEAPGPEELSALVSRVGREPISLNAQNELEVFQLPPAERAPFLLEFGIGEPAKGRVIADSYRAAGRISFFTVGDKEVRAWTIREGETAVEAAGEIHSDIERGFIRAELVSYQHYVEDGGVKGAREMGHFRLEGKEYLVKDGDLIEFRFSV